jgi:hypothetical protein
LYKFTKWGSIPATVSSSDVYIVAEDEKIAEQYDLELYVQYYESSIGLRHWKTVSVLAGTPLVSVLEEQGRPDLISDHVWDGIWTFRDLTQNGLQNMPERSVALESQAYPTDYFISVRPKSDGVHIITWQSKYATGSNVWTVKKEAVYDGDPIVQPATPSMPQHPEYVFSGWTPSVPATMPASNLVFNAVWNSGSGSGTGGGESQQDDTVCNCRFVVKYVENGFRREAVFQESKQKKGDVLKFPTGVKPSQYYLFVDWQIKIDNPGQTFYVPDESEHTYYGYCGDWNTDIGQLLGYARVYYVVPIIDETGMHSNFMGGVGLDQNRQFYFRYYAMDSTIDDSLAGTPPDYTFGDRTYHFEKWVPHETYIDGWTKDITVYAHYVEQVQKREYTLSLYAEYVSSWDGSQPRSRTLLAKMRVSNENNLKNMDVSAFGTWTMREMYSSYDVSHKWVFLDDSSWDGRVTGDLSLKCYLVPKDDTHYTPAVFSPITSWIQGFVSWEDTQKGQSGKVQFKVGSTVIKTTYVKVGDKIPDDAWPTQDYVNRYFAGIGQTTDLPNIISWNDKQTTMNFFDITFEAVITYPVHVQFYAKRFDESSERELIGESWGYQVWNINMDKKHQDGDETDPLSIVTGDWETTEITAGKEYEKTYYYGVRKNISTFNIPGLTAVSFYAWNITSNTVNEPTQFNQNQERLYGKCYYKTGTKTPEDILVNNFDGVKVSGTDGYIHYGKQLDVKGSSVSLKGGYFTFVNSKTQRVYFYIDGRQRAYHIMNVGIRYDFPLYLLQKGNISASQRTELNQKYKLYAEEIYREYNKTVKKRVQIPLTSNLQDYHWFEPWQYYVNFYFETK